jgi:hypothetical protein
MFLLRWLILLIMLECLATFSVAICGLSVKQVGSLARVGVHESAIFVIIELGNLKMRCIFFVAKLLYHLIMNILECLNLGPTVLSLRHTTTKIPGLMISSAGFWSQLGDIINDFQLVCAR